MLGSSSTFLARESNCGSRRTFRLALDASDRTFSISLLTLSIILSHICYLYTFKCTNRSFLPISHSHLWVQTVPLSQRDTLCPVVTPSRKGLARYCLFCINNYYIYKSLLFISYYFNNIIFLTIWKEFLSFLNKTLLYYRLRTSTSQSM